MKRQSKTPEHTLSNFVLSQDEAGSRLWKRLMLHLDGELALLRIQNDSVALSIAETTAKRGEIRFADRMLALTDEAGLASRDVDAEEGADVHFPPHGG